MTARLFRCNITNTGAAPIVWVADNLDHGEWADGSLPSQAAGTIAPGQAGHYQAESGGDIPVFGSIMTGTEGWVLFRTTNASGTTEFLKVSHFLPYWAPKRGASVEVTRFDPRIQPGTAEFDTRDMSPGTISVKLSANSPSDLLAEIQSLPWMIFWSVGQIFTQPFGDFHWHLNIDVSGTAPPASTTIPFPTTAPPPMSSKSYRFSNPQQWKGVWDSDDGRITAVISVQSDGMLKASVVERSPSGDRNIEASNLPISRTSLLNVRGLFEYIPGLAQQGRLMRELPPWMVQVERQGGDRYEKLDVLTRDREMYTAGVAEVDRTFAVAERWNPLELGGDYLSLPDDAYLEIQQVSSGGTVIGYGLRYIRPGFVPMLIAGSIDTQLHPRFVLN